MSGIWAFGSKLVIAGTTVSEVTNVSVPGMSADSIDVTTHNSADYAREFIKGLIDGGEINVEGNWTYSEYSTLYASMATTSMQSVSVYMPTTPSATLFQVNAFMTALDGDNPHDDKSPFSSTFKISGLPTVSQV